MVHFRSRLAHVFLLMGLVAWVVGVGARYVHAASETHQVCAEHGELVDVAHDSQPSDQLQITSAVPDGDHSHDCALQAMPGFAIQVTSTAPLVLPKQIAKSERSVRTDPARGPPLAFAPKTSPPLS